jgi:hypothetical protein
MPTPVKMTKKRQGEFLQGLAEGLSVSMSAKFASVGRSTAYDWRTKDKCFAALWDGAIEEGSDLLEDEAWRRAVNGTDRPVGFYQGVAGDVIKSYSDRLLIFLLKARRPSKFGDKIETSTGENSMAELNAEDAEILKRAGFK